MTIPACETWWMKCIEIAVVVLAGTVVWLYFQNRAVWRGLRQMREELELDAKGEPTPPTVEKPGMVLSRVFPPVMAKPFAPEEE